jgi:hypothetical protein
MCTRLNPAKSGLSVASDDMMPSCCVTRAVASDACDFVRCGGVHRHHVACASGVNWRVTACSGVFYIALLISQYEPWPTSLPSPWMTQDRHCCAPSSPSRRSTSLVSGTCVSPRGGGRASVQWRPWATICEVGRDSEGRCPQCTHLHPGSRSASRSCAWGHLPPQSRTPSANLLHAKVRVRTAACRSASSGMCGFCVALAPFMLACDRWE